MAARTQHARYLSKRAKRIVDMLEHIEGHDDLKGPVGVGKPLSRPEPEGDVRAILEVGELSTGATIASDTSSPSTVAAPQSTA